MAKAVGSDLADNNDCHLKVIMLTGDLAQGVCPGKQNAGNRVVVMGDNLQYLQVFGFIPLQGFAAGRQFGDEVMNILKIGDLHFHGAVEFF